MEHTRAAKHLYICECVHLNRLRYFCKLNYTINDKNRKQPSNLFSLPAFRHKLKIQKLTYMHAPRDFKPNLIT